MDIYLNIFTRVCAILRQARASNNTLKNSGGGQKSYVCAQSIGARSSARGGGEVVLFARLHARAIEMRRGFRGGSLASGWKQAKQEQNGVDFALSSNTVIFVQDHD